MDEQIREYLRNTKPIMASNDEKKALRRLSAKAIIIMSVCVVGSGALCIAEGAEVGALKFMGAFVLLIGIIILVLELKDKIKIKSYKKIYTIPMYVESSIYVNKAFQASLCYFDHSYSAFNKVTMRIDVMDVKFHPIRTGGCYKDNGWRKEFQIALY